MQGKPGIDTETSPRISYLLLDDMDEGELLSA
jgi:hypothetical protein